MNDNRPKDRDREFEKLLKRFKKNVEKNDIMACIRRKEEYVKPSMVKRLKRLRAINRNFSSKKG